MNAIFISTSAKSSEGINNLFEEIAKKHTGTDNITVKKENLEEPPKVEPSKDTIKLDSTGKGKNQKKKGCC